MKDKKPPCRREDAEAVLRRLRESGHVAYFAGGCVRDLLLGLDPKDWDVATDAPPPRVRQLFPRTQAVGAKFGVILVRQGESVVEVATFRTDGSYKDGRHPIKVEFTTPEQDAQRRDFTINGLFLDPLDNDRVIDFVGGQEDLKNKILRAIGNANLRFEEDHLRMLRAARFAARFGLKIAPSTAKAIVEHAPQLQRISPERIAEELRLMLTPPTRGDAYLLLRQYGLLDVIMRFLPERQTRRPDMAFSLFLALGPPLHRGAISFGLALAAATLEFRMHASGRYEPLTFATKPEIGQTRRAMRQALHISNDEEYALWGAHSFAALLQDSPTVAMMKRFLAHPYSADAQLLMSAIAKVGLLSERIESVIDRLRVIAKSDVAPPPLLTGDDLTAVGYKPGPPFKRVLDQVYDAQLEDQIKTKEEAMELAKKLMPG